MFQAFSGSGDGLSASEKAGIDRAANAKPWVHMVSNNPHGMHQDWTSIKESAVHLNRHAQGNNVP